MRCEAQHLYVNRWEFFSFFLSFLFKVRRTYIVVRREFSLLIWCEAQHLCSQLRMHSASILAVFFVVKKSLFCVTMI